MGALIYVSLNFEWRPLVKAIGYIDGRGRRNRKIKNLIRRWKNNVNN